MSKILGLHHITLVTNDAQRNVDFYAGTLGLRFVKKTVNFDDPSAYHLYYGNETGDTGTAITFFEWRNAPAGKPGLGGTHHVALTVKDMDALLMWKRYLTDQGITVHGPYDRHYFTSIYFNDPDGTILELVTAGPGFAVDEPLESLGTSHMPPPEAMMIANRDEERIKALTWAEPVPEITSHMMLDQGMHHITAIGANIERSHAFFGELLGLNLVKQTDNFDDPNSKHWYWSAGDGTGKPGTLITYFERNPSKTRYVRMGAGQTHHYAFAVADDEAQLEWREKLLSAGLRVSPVMDRDYFHSIYTQDPDGHIVEIATVPPGFTVDEPLETLGTELRIPEFLSPHREMIEKNLTPITVPEWKGAKINE